MYVVEATDTNGETEQFGVTDKRADNRAQAIHQVAKEIGGEYSDYDGELDADHIGKIEVIGERDQDLRTL